MPDKDGFMDASEARIKRNDDGSIIPETVDTHLGKIKVTPLSEGQQSEFRKAIENEGEIGPEQSYKLVKEHIKKPNPGALFPDMEAFNDLKLGYSVACGNAVLEASGMTNMQAEATEEGVGMTKEGEADTKN